MSGDPKMFYDALLLALDQRFHGAALGEALVDIFERADVVELPQVDVIGVEKLK